RRDAPAGRARRRGWRCRRRCRKVPRWEHAVSWVQELARPDIVALEPYEHASWEPSLERLHANELPWRPAHDDSHAGLNRYPEPQPRALVEGLAALYGVAPATILVGRG